MSSVSGRKCVESLPDAFIQGDAGEEFADLGLHVVIRLAQFRVSGNALEMADHAHGVAEIFL